MSKPKAEQVHDGVPFDMKTGTPWSLQCCDCGMVRKAIAKLPRRD